MVVSRKYLIRRRAMAGAAIALLFTPAIAQAAEPGAPERLAAQAAGVVGSGDQLSLRVRETSGERVVKIGEVYADGWTLQALTPSKATLAKDGATREVGLNPTGALASNAPAGPPTTVTLVGLPNEAMIQAAIAKYPAMYAQMTAQVKGLTTEEARRYFAEIMMVQEEATRRQAAGEVVGALDMTTLRAVLGDTAAEDYIAIRSKGNIALVNEQIADLKARPFTGPDSYYVPAGADPTQVAAAQNIDTRGGWRSSPPDARGGVTRTRTVATAAEAAQNLAQGLASMAANPSGIPGAAPPAR